MALPDYRESTTLGDLLRRYPATPVCARCRLPERTPRHRRWRPACCSFPELHHAFEPGA
jgi:hypothetical protein